MLEVDQVRDCKRFYAQGRSIRGIARELNISRNTVRCYLRGERLPGLYLMERQRRQPVKEILRPFVLALLQEEKESKAPRKQRLTASRIHRLLITDGHRFSASTVRSLVQEIRLDLRDPLDRAYIPLAYDPGRDGQVDFFEGVVIHADRGREKVNILLVRACYSTRTFAYAAPNQTREALLEGLMQAFEFFGGVFQNLWFDNLTPAVRKVLKGRTRELQRAFSVFQAHYGFKAEFCSPGKGNEKGGVENEVKYSRSEILTPIPVVKGREDVQKLCTAWMEGDLNRQIRGHDKTIGEFWQDEIPHLVPLPASRFDAGLVRKTTVTPRSWVAFGTNFYSVPVEWVGHEVEVKTEAEAIVVLHRNDPPVRHKRCYERFQMVLEMEHYLPLLRRKSRGLDRSVPFRRWIKEVDPCWKALLSTLRHRQGEVEGSQDFVDAVLLCKIWGLKRTTAAVQKALRRPEVSMATVRYYLWQHRKEETRRPESIAYEGPQVVHKSPTQYMSLYEVGGGAHE